MRTIFLPNITLNQELNSSDIILKENDFYHLINVLRLKNGDKIQVTNGQGQSATSTLNIINKKSASLKIQSIDKNAKPTTQCLSLLCGIPKKGTVEEILRIGTEIGLKEIFFWRSSFSQSTFPSHSRIELIIKNSMEQSNNLWEPKIHCLEKIFPSLFKSYDHLIIFHNAELEGFTKIERLNGNILFVIGPEGGLSLGDLSFFQHLNLISKHYVHLNTPILTMPTAVSCGLGYIMGLTLEK